MPDAEVFQQLAQAAGHKNYEPWWNLLVEQRQDGRDLFAAILEMMTAVRDPHLNPLPAGGAIW